MCEIEMYLMVFFTVPAYEDTSGERQNVDSRWESSAEPLASRSQDSHHRNTQKRLASLSKVTSSRAESVGTEIKYILVL